MHVLERERLRVSQYLLKENPRLMSVEGPSRGTTRQEVGTVIEGISK